MKNFIKVECSSNQQGFAFIHTVNHGENVSVSHVDRDLFSVFILLDGEIDFIIEGKRFHLLPKDILLVGNNELHRSVFKKELDCEYALLTLNLDFFVKHNCTEFSEMFFNRALGTNNIITHDRVQASGLMDIVKRIDKYAKEDTPNVVVIRGVIIELLYNLDQQVAKSERTGCKQEKIKEIIEYINDNLSKKITLEDIASHFYLTRQYLCKLFKQSTGFTVNKYISYKRIVLVREYHFKGLPLNLACEKVGFSDYSAFYRAYHKIMDESPSQGMSKINI